jgi:hypothetical protein
MQKTTFAKNLIMKTFGISLFAAALFVFSACQNTSNSYELFGEDFNEKKGLITSEALDKLFDDTEIGDTIDVTFSTKIDAVCKKKGCWMEVDLADDNVVRVTFKDYGFFVPLNAGESEAIVHGKAFWKVETMTEKLHYAEDAGEDPDDIDEIEGPEYEPHIIATGVKIKK